MTPGETEVKVTYDVTSLGPEGAAFVEELRDGMTSSSTAGRRSSKASPATGTSVRRAESPVRHALSYSSWRRHHSYGLPCG
jgi:hypothetical protein